MCQRSRFHQGIAIIFTGVGVKNWAEAIVHRANDALEKLGHDHYMAMIKIDFANAFNTTFSTRFIAIFLNFCHWFFCYSSCPMLFGGGKSSLVNLEFNKA
jgi:hypothetical protein